MSSETLEVGHLVERLERIARKNDDVFKYRIDINANIRGIDSFTFVAVEEADGHQFVAGDGKTIEGATADALRGIKSALSSWGYVE